VNKMEKMQELYDKVAKDDTLQAKFNEIMNSAEKAGKEETAANLVAFAKEAGFDVTAEEIQAFFKNLVENQNGSLSDAELDMVAGGKSVDGCINVFCSVSSFGIACIISSIYYRESCSGIYK
jgi:predicted ribosomally synthesized peptide with nif11-like leader